MAQLIKSMNVDPRIIKCCEKVESCLADNHFDYCRELVRLGIKAFPTSDVMQALLGKVEYRAGNISIAADCFTAAVELMPSACNRHSLAIAKQALGEDYLPLLKMAADDGFVPAMVDLGKFTEDEDVLNDSLALEPTAQAYFQLGQLAAKNGDLIKHFHFMQKAYALNPHDPHIRFQYGLGNLRNGNFETAWKIHVDEWREHKLYKLFNENLCDITPRATSLDDVQGKTVYVYNVQGDGDLIQYSRYVLELKQHCHVILESGDRLRDFLKSCCHEFAPEQRVVNDDGVLFQDLPDFDLHVELMELPAWFDFVPPPIPTETSPKTIKSDQRKIGICWAGNPEHDLDEHRSCSLEHFGKLDGQLFSFQIDKRLMADVEMVDMSPFLYTYQDTADYAAAMDVVVTVDTSLAHVCGTIGIPTILMVPIVSDYRWGVSDHCRWYDSIIIVRQRELGNWSDVFDRVNEILSHQS